MIAKGHRELFEVKEMFSISTGAVAMQVKTH